VTSCAGKAGEVQWMEVSYGEGIASHTGPELCGDDREVVVEALTGERAGRVSSATAVSAACSNSTTAKRPDHQTQPRGPHSPANQHGEAGPPLTRRRAPPRITRNSLAQPSHTRPDDFFYRTVSDLGRDMATSGTVFLDNPEKPVCLGRSVHHGQVR
jgi:hypothetical protein